MYIIYKNILFMIYTIVHVIYDIKNCINHKNTITVSITISQIHYLRLMCDQYPLHTAQCVKLSQEKRKFSVSDIKRSIIISSSISIYQISEKQFSRVFIGSRNSEYPWLLTVLRSQPKWRLISRHFWKTRFVR